MSFIYHLVAWADWDAASAQPDYAASSLESEGFIHCSKDRDQLFAVARRLYAGRADLLALELDANRLAAPIKEEPARSGEIFPHIYGPINKDAVARVLALALDEGGEYSLRETEG